MSSGLPTPDEAADIKEDAIERSGAGAEEDWKAEAAATVILIANRREPFSANDVWAAGLVHPPNKRALGYVMRSLEAQDYIRRTGDKVRSRWGHMQDISVWVKA